MCSASDVTKIFHRTSNKTGQLTTCFLGTRQNLRGIQHVFPGNEILNPVKTGTKLFSERRTHHVFPGNEVLTPVKNGAKLFGIHRKTGQNFSVKGEPTTCFLGTWFSTPAVIKLFRVTHLR